MATFDELRLQELLKSFNNTSDNTGITSIDQQYTDPKYTYDGLYQDPDRFLDYDNSRKDNSSMGNDYPFTLNIPTNRLARRDAIYYNKNNLSALPSNAYGEKSNYFNNFAPRIGLPNQVPQNLAFLPNQVPQINSQVPQINSQIPQINNQVPPQNLGINTSYGVANEPDEEQVEYLTEQEPSGIAKLFEFLQQFSPLRGLAALSDKLKQSSMYRPSTTGVFGYTPAQLNQMNALGGFYSEPERERRRRANRISNMLQRAAKGKNYSKKNLQKLMNQFDMGDTDTRGMIDSIKASADMGYGRGGGRDFDSGRDYSSSPGAIAGDMEYGEE